MVYSMNEEERKEVSRRFLIWALATIAHPSVRNEVEDVLENIRKEDLQ